MEYITEEYVAPRLKPSIVRPEINLAKWSQIFAPHNTPGKSRVIKRGDSTVIIGQVMTKKGELTETGFLIVPDLIVLTGLIHLWELSGKSETDWVTGRVRGFMTDLLRRPAGGANYQEFEYSLRRLLNIPISWVNAFYDSRTRKLETINDFSFHFLQLLKTTKQRFSAGRKLEFTTFSFKFNDHFLQNLLNGSTKPLDFREVTKFKRETSVLAYFFLDLVMAQRTYWSRRASAFLKDDLQITSVRYTKPALRREALHGILDELRGCALSTGVISEASLKRTNDNQDWKLIIHKQPFDKTLESTATQALRPGTSETEAIVQEIMAKLGLREKNRRFYQLLAQRCPREVIHIALQDTLMEARSGKIQTSKAAFFGYWIQELCRQRGIALPIKSSFTQGVPNS